MKLDKKFLQLSIFVSHITQSLQCIRSFSSKTDVSFSKHHLSVVLEVFFFWSPSCMYIINFTSKRKRKACMEFIFNTFVTPID